MKWAVTQKIRELCSLLSTAEPAWMATIPTLNSPRWVCGAQANMEFRSKMRMQRLIRDFARIRVETVAGAIPAGSVPRRR